MNPVPNESIKEVAATREGRRPVRRLASQEFFFLLQRIDRLDEKFTGEIRRLDEKMSKELKRISDRALAAVVTLIAGFAGIIITLLYK